MAEALPLDDLPAWDQMGVTKPANGHVTPKAVVREAIRELILPHLRPLVEAQIAQAVGIKYLVARDADGKFRRIGPEGIEGADVIEVWEKDPSTPAFTDLLNRAADRPKEQEPDAPIQHAVTFAWRASEE